MSNESLNMANDIRAMDAVQWLVSHPRREVFERALVKMEAGSLMGAALREAAVDTLTEDPPEWTQEPQLLAFAAEAVSSFYVQMLTRNELRVCAKGVRIRTGTEQIRGGIDAFNRLRDAAGLGS